MMTSMMNEDQVLDIEFRRQVLQEILAPENVARRTEHDRRYQVYKDKTVKWVLNSFKAEGMQAETVAQMSNRATNVSICRKIVNKLAKTYSSGVQRSGSNDAETEAIEAMAEYLTLTAKMRKSDRYRELHKNCLVQIVQEQCGGNSANPVYRIGLRVLGPWQYDVVEDMYDREIPRVIILSDFIEQNQQFAQNEIDAGKHVAGNDLNYTNRKDDIIADAPTDAGEGKKRVFIWWTDKYHFTTYQDGAYCDELTPDDNVNPIGMLPFVNNAEEQDGQFWAIGGDDIVDGSILVNKMLTDMNFVAYLQGFGQFVITGRNLRDKYSVGPNNALVFDYDQDDPEPKVTVVSANPPLADWMAMIEQYCALLLTTNNLAPTSIAGKLEAGRAMAGIAKLIDSSEATNDVSDKMEEYSRQEREIMEIVQAFQAILIETDEVDDEFKALPKLPDDVGMSMSTKFNDVKQTVTEAEKLANLKLRKDLGIDTMVDLVMMDNPDLDQADAEEKVQALIAERMQNQKFYQEIVADQGGKGGQPGGSGQFGQNGSPNDQNPPPVVPKAG